VQHAGLHEVLGPRVVGMVTLKAAGQTAGKPSAFRDTQATS
jgi:hypothetical protein